MRVMKSVVLDMEHIHKAQKLIEAKKYENFSEIVRKALEMLFKEEGV